MEQAAFKLDSYQFRKAFLDFDIPQNATLEIDLNPKGTFYAKTSQFERVFDVLIGCVETKSEMINVSCVAKFTFQGHISIDEIPDYFYPNSLAILFPYVRAFVSTMSLQANINPIVLPTINLMGITETLRQNTKVVQ